MEELLFDDRLEKLRRAGKIHQEIRQWIQPQLKPGINLLNLATLIEDRIQELTHYDPQNPLKAGIAFPTGLSVNQCAAHWTPSSTFLTDPHQSTPILLGEQDLIKIDFGIHLEGEIIDAAFSHTSHPELLKLVEAANQATQAATREAGPDAILGEIGGVIEEVISSYQVNERQVVPIRQLCGHNIEPYRIHANKAVPNISMPKYRERMQVGEIYAIETFPSTGTGQVREDHSNNTHFMINYANPNWENIHLKKSQERKMLEFIKKNRNTLAFCPRWYSSEQQSKMKKGLQLLIDKGVINPYPPLYDIQGSHVAQFEQTIAVKENGIEVLS